MGWIIAIVFFLICGVMEQGEKERSVTDRKFNQPKSKDSEGMAAVMADGLRTFDAGIRRVNRDLELKAQAGEILRAFAKQNQDAVNHFKLCSMAVFAEKTYKNFLGNRQYSQDLVFDHEHKTNHLSSLYSNFDEQFMLTGSSQIKPFGNNKFFIFDFSSIAHERNPELLCKIHEKIKDILDNTKDELIQIKHDVSFNKCQDEYYALLDKFGEKDLFNQITMR